MVASWPPRDETPCNWSFFEDNGENDSGTVFEDPSEYEENVSDNGDCLRNQIVSMVQQLKFLIEEKLNNVTIECSRKCAKEFHTSYW